MKAKRRRAREVKRGRGWAWTIEDRAGHRHLCNWAEPFRDVLVLGGKPSPESIAVAVYIVPRNLRRLARRKR